MTAIIDRQTAELIDVASMPVLDVPTVTVDSSADITVLKGNPTDVELAALVAVLTQAGAAASRATATGPLETWGHPTFLHREAVHAPTAFAVNPALRF